MAGFGESRVAVSRGSGEDGAVGTERRVAFAVRGPVVPWTRGTRLDCDARNLPQAVFGGAHTTGRLPVGSTREVCVVSASRTREEL
ncbi:hypothetical protein CEP50_09245 [Actinopolyspora mortivallis]|uniref:Uncharacterized protein n=1 Tax=Actinopolyspora mortivallis TaxID=33906 RepID=A0A2T0GWZ9_ACTMO|nr:hypothetical protein CEP50_09245 [Actinopolyspora mortivallis]